MKMVAVLASSVLLLSACGPAIDIYDGSPSASRTESEQRRETHRGPRGVRVPPGHYPKRGECRLWFEGRPPGHQPRPTSCSNLVGRVPDGAFILHGGKAWDSEYDWRAYNRRNPGSVPHAILQLTTRRA